MSEIDWKREGERFELEIYGLVRAMMVRAMRKYRRPSIAFGDMVDDAAIFAWRSWRCCDSGAGAAGDRHLGHRRSVRPDGPGGDAVPPGWGGATGVAPAPPKLPIPIARPDDKPGGPPRASAHVRC